MKVLRSRFVEGRGREIEDQQDATDGQEVKRVKPNNIASDQHNSTHTPALSETKGIDPVRKAAKKAPFKFKPRSHRTEDVHRNWRYDGTCECRPGLLHEPPELLYDEYDIYLTLQTIFKDIKRIVGYVSKATTYATNWDVVWKRLNRVGNDRQEWKTRWVDLKIELDLLSDYKYWSRNEKGDCALIADEAFYKSLEDNLASDIAEVEKDLEDHLKGSEEDPGVNEIIQAGLHENT